MCKWAAVTTYIDHLNLKHAHNASENLTTANYARTDICYCEILTKQRINFATTAISTCNKEQQLPNQ